MSDSNIRRVISGVSAFALAAGLAVTFGSGVASAAQGKQEWSHGDTSFVRTVSNATPSEGDVITVKTVFSRKSIVEWLWTVSEYRPACLTYVDGSAKVSGNNVDLKTSGTDSSGAKFVQVKGNWPVYPNIEPKTQTFSFDYKVGADCARTVAMNTWMNYTGSLGDGNYGPGNMDKSIPVTVQKNTTTTTLGTVMSGVQVGQSVPLKATVTRGAVGDTVEFYDGTTNIGGGTLDASGVATVNWTPTVKGTHNLTAKFAATSKADTSVSAVQSVGVSQADVASSTTLAAAAGSQVGTSTTLTATVNPAGAGGTVTFTVDGKPTVVGVGANGEATYAWVPATAGSQTITAEFSGREGVSGSSTSTNVTVADAPVSNTDSATVLTVDAAQVGKATTVKAQVTPAGSGGTVTFKDGDTVIGSAPVDSAGVASLAWTPAIAGQRTVTAEFSGVGTVNGSADSSAVQVADAETPGGGNGGGDGGTDSGAGGLGSLGDIFGS